MRPSVAAVLLVLILIGCADRTGIQRSADDPFLTSPAHMAYNVKVQLTDSAATKAILQARLATIDERAQTTTMKGSVVVDFYDRGGSSVEARLTADSVVVHDRTKDMTAYGNVRVESQVRRITLTTTSLMWVHATSRVRTEDAVHIETGSETIDGVELESNQDLSSYRLFQVRGVRRNP